MLHTFFQKLFPAEFLNPPRLISRLPVKRCGAASTAMSPSPTARSFRSFQSDFRVGAVHKMGAGRWETTSDVRAMVWDEDISGSVSGSASMKAPHYTARNRHVLGKSSVGIYRRTPPRTGRALQLG